MVSRNNSIVAQAMMMMIMIIVLKGAIRDFYNLLTARTLKWHNLVQITCNSSGAYNVQHVCHVVRRHSY